MNTVARAKPSLRGVSHELAAYLSLISGAVLLWLSRRYAETHTEGETIFWGNAVYAASLTLLFGISAFYHRPQWTPAKRAVLRRIDHSAIYLLIAGTGTALALASLRGADGSSRAGWFLVVYWGGALLGILKSIFWIQAPKPVTALAYSLMALSAVPFFPQMGDRLGAPGMLLIVLGGVFYLLGASAYAFRRPDPWPATFGYHEIFHLLVIAGTACHYGAILGMVL
jgi:hemolysin III